MLWRSFSYPDGGVVLVIAPDSDRRRRLIFLMLFKSCRYCASCLIFLGSSVASVFIERQHINIYYVILMLSCPLPILIPDSSSRSHFHRMRLLSIVRLAKKKTEKHSQSPQISPACCRVEEERGAIILGQVLLDWDWIGSGCIGTYRAPDFNI